MSPQKNFPPSRLETTSAVLPSPQIPPPVACEYVVGSAPENETELMLVDVAGALEGAAEDTLVVDVEVDVDVSLAGGVDVELEVDVELDVPPPPFPLPFPVGGAAKAEVE